MTETVAVIDWNRAVEEAYDMGYSEFSDLPTDGEEAEDFELSHFKDSARFCNHILPSLRALAGFEDSGHGTYTGGRTAVVVEEPDDLPAEGRETEAHHVLSDLVEKYDKAAYDAVDGRDREPFE